MALPAGAFAPATIEISQPVQLTDSEYYERGQSIVYDGTNYWLFYGRSASCTGTYKTGTPDVYDYALYYKKAATVAGLAAAPATAVIGDTIQPVNFHNGETGAAYYDGKVWAFAPIEDPDHPGRGADYGWYTTDGSSWTAVGPFWDNKLYGSLHHDEVSFGGDLWIVEGAADGAITTQHGNPYDPTTPDWGDSQLSIDLGPSGGIVHFFVDDEELYLAIFECTPPESNVIYHYDAVNDKWDEIDNVASGGWDPTLFKVDSTYVFAQAPCDGDRQYTTGWSANSLDGSFFDRVGDPVSVTGGQYASNVWVDMWPIGFTDAGGNSYLFFTSERNPNDPASEIAGNIWYLPVTWDVSRNHYTYIQPAIDAANPGDTINVAAGTYPEVLNLVSKGLTIDGAGVDATIVDAHSFTGHAVQNFGNSTTIRNLKLIGTSDSYGFKVSHVSNITFDSVKVENSHKTAFDLNTVNTATLTNIEAVDTAWGFGLMILDSTQVNVTNITTSGNAWGGVSVQTKDSTSDMVAFDDNFNAAEDAPFLLEQDPDPDDGTYHPITNVTIPAKLTHIVYAFRAPDSYKQWFYQENVGNAKTLAQALMSDATYTYSEMTIRDRVGANYYVIEGMKIQDAVDAASGTTIHVDAGTYEENVTIGTAGLSIISLVEHGAVINGRININADNVTFEGFEVVASGGEHLINIDNGVSGTEIIDNKVSAEYIEGAATSAIGNHCNHRIGDVTVAGNIVTRAIGFYVTPGAKVVIENNIVDTAGDEGIWLYDEVGDVTIVGNTVTNYNLRNAVDAKALAINHRPTSVNAKTTSGDMLDAIETDNPGIDSVDLKWAMVQVGESIQEAVNASFSGDTIWVAAGTYEVDNTIIVDKSVTITGPTTGTDAAIVIGQNSATIPVFNVTANDVTIKNLEITVTQQAITDYAATSSPYNGLIQMVDNTTGTEIKDNTIWVPNQGARNSMGTWAVFGIKFLQNCTGIVTGNTIFDTRQGISGSYGSSLNVQNNTIYNTKGGICIYTNQADIENHTIINNLWDAPDDATLSHNEWDIVWHTAYYVPDYQQSVVEMSSSNNDAYVLDRRAADATACANLTGNRSHIFVDTASIFNAANPARGNFNEPFSSISLGVDAVVPGGTINAAAGTYTEAVTISKPLTLSGATADVNKNGYAVPADYAWDDTVESIIMHPNPGSEYIAIVDIVDVSNVTFEGFVVQELNAVGSNDDSLVRVRAQSQEVSNIIIRNNIIGPFTNTTTQDGTHGRMGLYLVNNPYSDEFGIVDSTFSGNKIFDCQGNGNNVFIWSSYENYAAPGPASMDGTVIGDNEIYGSHRSGIETSGGYTGLTIENNKIYNNGGMFEADANNLKYGHGIVLIRGSSDSHSDTIPGFGPEDLTIENNEIYGNQKSGIYMGPISKNYTINGNKIHDNGWDGMRLDLAESYNNPDFEAGDRVPWADKAEGITAQFNDIYGNDLFGIRVIGEPTNGLVLKAKNNWWGTKSGPSDDGTGITDPLTGKPAAGKGDKVSANVRFDPWIGAKVENSKTQTVSGGGTVSTTDNTTKVTVSGSANVTVANYGNNNPGKGFSGNTGKYIDVNIDDPINVNEIEVRLYYTNAGIAGLVESSLRLRWWNGTDWLECSPYNGVTYPAGGPTYRGYMWAVISDNTTPNLTQLTGTPFSGGGTAATAPSVGGVGGVAGAGGLTLPTVGGLVSEPAIRLDAEGTIQARCLLRTADDKLTLDIATGTRLLDSIKRPLSSLSAALEPSPPAPPSDTAIILAYDLGLNGAVFTPAITMTIEYDPATFPEDIAEESLYIAYWDGSKWVTLTTTVDTTTRTASCKVSHFTTFALIGTITPPTAFSVSNLSIMPAEVRPNEAVAITVSVANSGDTEESYSVALKINGAIEAEESVTVAPGSSQSVSFSVTREEAGSYSVAVDGLIGSFTVATEAPPTPISIAWWMWVIAGVLVVGLIIFFVARRMAY